MPGRDRRGDCSPPSFAPQMRRKRAQRRARPRALDQTPGVSHLDQTSCSVHPQDSEHNTAIRAEKSPCSVSSSRGAASAMFERLSMARPASVVPASCYSVYAVRCLEENTLFEYVSDGLDTASRQAVVEHAASCESCRRMIAAAIDAAPSMHGAVTE